MIFGLRKEAVVLVVVFTIIEAVTLIGWLALAMNGETVRSVAVLVVGLFVEHIIATIAGTKAE